MHLFCFTWTFITIIENNFYYLHLDNGDIDKNSIKFIYLGWVILNRLLLYVLSLSIFTGITFSYSYDRYARQMLVLSLLSAQRFDCSLHNCYNEVDLKTRIFCLSFGQRTLIKDVKNEENAKSSCGAIHK